MNLISSLNLSSGAINGIIVVILCILAALLINDRSRFVEGMTANANAPVIATPLDELRIQVTGLKTVYDTLENGITAQTNTINSNSHILFQTMNDAPTQSNNITHANINMDDPSKTPMKSI